MFCKNKNNNKNKNYKEIMNSKLKFERFVVFIILSSFIDFFIQCKYRKMVIVRYLNFSFIVMLKGMIMFCVEVNL